MLRLLTIAIFVACLCRISLAQEKMLLEGSVQGKVTDMAIKQPLPGVSVTVMDTRYGGTTNHQGNYAIEHIPVGSYNLKFSLTGYKEVIKTDVIVKSNKITVGVDAELEKSVLELEEIVVRPDLFTKSKDTPVSTQNFSYEEIRRSPGSAEDISRLVQALLSVAMNRDTKNDLIVRGGNPSENLVLVDNIEVSSISHFAAQGTSGGGTGVLNLDFIREANFTAGGFPSKYGDRLSSVLDIKLREGNRKEFDSDLTFSMSGFGGVFEGPIQKGKGAWMFSARRSYLDLLKDILQISTLPQFSDYQGKVVYDLNASNKVSLIWLLGLDQIEIKAEDNAEDREHHRMSLDQYTVGANWQYLWSSNGYAVTTISHSKSRRVVNFDREDGTDKFDNNSNEGETVGRLDLAYKPAKRDELGFGIQAKIVDFSHHISFASYTNPLGESMSGSRIDNEVASFKLGGYAQYIRDLTYRLRGSVGLRYDYFEFTRKGNLAPRLSLSYQFTDRFALNSSYGQFYQSPPVVWLSQHERNKELKNTLAEHYVIGMEYRLKKDINLTVEAYDKEYRDYPVSLTDPSHALSGFGSSFDYYDVRQVVNGGRGYARGIEFLVQKKMFDNYYGLISYAYCVSKYKGLDGTEISGDFDVRNSFTFIAGYRPNEQLEFGLKWHYAGGRPYTPLLLAESKSANQNIYDRSQLNGKRNPPYHRLDIRIDRRLHFKRLNIVTYIDIQNLYNRKNIDKRFWNKAEQKPDVEYQWPRMPVLGFSFEF